MSIEGMRSPPQPQNSAPTPSGDRDRQPAGNVARGMQIEPVEPLTKAPASHAMLKVRACQRLAVLRLHGPNSAGSPQILTVACSAMRATIWRLEKLHVHAIWRFMPAPWTCRLNGATMRRTSSRALHLVQEAVVAACHAGATVAEHFAIASLLACLDECHVQRFCWQAQCFVQPNDINQSPLRRNAPVGIDVRSYQPHHSRTRQRIRHLEFPQDRDERLPWLDPLLVEYVAQRRCELCLVEREDRKARCSHLTRRRRRGHVRLHGVTGHNRNAVPHEPATLARDSSPGNP